MKKKQNDKQAIIHHCGECRLAKHDRKFENLSLEGQPTLVSCKYSGRFKRVVSEKACKFFESKDFDAIV